MVFYPMEYLRDISPDGSVMLKNTFVAGVRMTEET